MVAAAKTANCTLGLHVHEYCHSQHFLQHSEALKYTTDTDTLKQFPKRAMTFNRAWSTSPWGKAEGNGHVQVREETALETQQQLLAPMRKLLRRCQAFHSGAQQKDGRQ